MKIERINIIGFGNVGQNLFFHLKNKITIASVYNRTKSKQIIEILGDKYVNDINLLKDDVDLNIIVTNDSSIGEVSKLLPINIPVVHTSGSIDKNILSNFKNYGVLYPLQTFTRNRKVKMDEIPFLIESNSENFKSIIVEFTKKNFSNKLHFFSSKQRGTIHVGAVFINNFTTLMAREAEIILKESNIDFSILEPLLKETIRNIIETSPSESQTGPAKRRDSKVVLRHLSLFSNGEQKKIYELLSNRIEELSSSF